MPAGSRWHGDAAKAAGGIFCGGPCAWSVEIANLAEDKSVPFALMPACALTRPGSAKGKIDPLSGWDST
jgi:hypothetical protein